MKTERFNNTEKAICFLLYWIAFQDIILGILYHFSHVSAIASALLYLKDVVLLVLFIGCLFHIRIKRKLLLVEYIYVFYIFVLAIVSVVRTDLSLSSIAASARGLVLCPAFMIIGSGIVHRERMKDFIIRKYFGFILALALIGIVEWILDALVGTKGFWTNVVGIGDLYVDIKHSIVYKGFPTNFYGYANGMFFARKRLVSIWGNPLTAGYSFLIPAIYYFCELYDGWHLRNNKNTQRKFVGTIIILSAIILTYTRAIILGFMIGVIVVYIFKNRKRISNIAFAALVVSFLILLYLLFSDFGKIRSFLMDGSTEAHLRALIRSSEWMSFFGSGVGMFGANGGRFVTESVYFAVWGQVGLIGLGLFVIICLKAIKASFVQAKHYGNFALAIGASWVVYLITAFLSEQLTAYTTIAPAFILLGMNQYPDAKYEA